MNVDKTRHPFAEAPSVSFFDPKPTEVEVRLEAMRMLVFSFLGFSLFFLFLTNNATARECDLGVVQARFNRKIPELKTYVIAHNQKTDDCYMYAYDRAKKQGSFITMPLGSYCLPTGEARPLSLRYLREELQNPAVEVNARSWQEVRALLGIAFNRQQGEPLFSQIATAGECNTYLVQESFKIQAHHLVKRGHRFLVLSYHPLKQTAEIVMTPPDRSSLSLVRVQIIDCAIDTEKEFWISL